MHRLNDLRHGIFQFSEINGTWVPARPLDGRRGYATFKQRISDAWKVFTCEAEAFIWPEDEKPKRGA